MGIIDAIFAALSGVANGVVNVFSGIFDGVGGLFYVEDTGLTLLGVLSLVAVGVGLFAWVFRMIQNLIRVRVKA